jgi:polyhydroxyalkanoate synthesis regulator phasin
MSQAQTQDLSGLSLFGRLVEQGRPVEERGRRAMTALSERTSETFREFGKLLQDTVEYESKSFMKRLGLATRDEVKALSLRVDALARNVEEMVARWQVEQALARTDVASTAPWIIETTASGTPERTGA